MPLFQAAPQLPATPWELVNASSPETLVVLVIIAVASLASWFLIGLKGWQFRRLRQQSARFLAELGRSPRLAEAYRSIMKLPPSPFNRLFREGVSFYSQLQPGALKDDGGHGALSPSQLEALKLVLGKEIAAQRDGAGAYVTWLATIGAVGPLLGLLGTVLGVMDAFLGIARGGSGNLSVVAPGVAEALITTVAGLAAAIPALVGYNYFSNQVGQFEAELEGFGNTLIGWMAREGLL